VDEASLMGESTVRQNQHDFLILEMQASMAQVASLWRGNTEQRTGLSWRLEKAQRKAYCYLPGTPPALLSCTSCIDWIKHLTQKQANL